uniref:Variant surface glycoprotein 1327 n=1 Tax=Trypanosoma brucei TaxID=5691 RepID=M4TBD8_9TRYP|nr:variant surface glycoprotein 1327 [Trypanosoma brucei]
MSCTFHSLLLVLNVLIYKDKLRQAQGAALDNAADFNILCHVYNIYEVKDKIPNLGTFEKGDQLVEELTNLNISTASDSWFDHGNGQLVKADKTTDEAKLQQWRTEKQEVVKKQNQGEHEYRLLGNAPARQKANLRIYRLLNQSKQIVEDYEIQVELIETKNKAVETKITETIFGPGKTAFNSGEFAESARHNTCGSTGAGHANAGQSVAAALICIRTGESGAAQQECEDGLTGQVQNAGSQGGAATTAKGNIVNKCKLQPKPAQVTDATIAAAIASVTARIGQLNTDSTAANGKFTLGKTTATTCDGTAGTKQCVNYKMQLGTNGGTLPWLTALEQAAQDLKEAQSAAFNAVALKNSLLELNRQGRNAYMSASFDEANPQVLTATTNLGETGTRNQGSDQKQAQKTEKECNAKEKDSRMPKTMHMECRRKR